MVTIVAIPSYYQSGSYPFTQHGTRPTATARYIILTPASSETLTTRNTAILKDVTTWGWRVYNTSRSLPKMEKWFTKYEKAAKNNNWDDDIWHIWQREHGLKIAEEDQKRKVRAAGEKGKMGAALHTVMRVRECFGGMNNMSLDYDERQLRRNEAGKEEERRWKVADGRLEERPLVSLPDPFSDSQEVSEEEEEHKDTSGGLSGGVDTDAKATSGEGTETVNSVVLPRHAWLSRG